MVHPLLICPPSLPIPLCFLHHSALYPSARNDPPARRHLHGRQSSTSPCHASPSDDDSQEQISQTNAAFPHPPVSLVQTLSDSKALARVLLLVVPALWGTYGPAIRYVYEQEISPAPSVLTFARKAVSVLFLLCFIPFETSANKPLLPVSQELMESKNREEMSFIQKDTADFSAVNQLSAFFTGTVGLEWFAAIELGLWTFLATACQTDGLENTTATRSGFLLQTVTVLVPMLSAFSGVKVRSVTWVAAILALLGVTYLSIQSQDVTWTMISSSAMWKNLNVSKGDVEILLAAFFYALYTVRLSAYAVGAQAVQLSTKIMVVSTILAGSWVLNDHVKSSLQEGVSLQPLQSPTVVLAIIFSAFVPGTLASIAQTIGQKSVPPSEAQVYFSLQPFWSAVFAALLLKENMDSSSWVAGVLVATAAFMASWDTLSSKEE